MNADQRRDYELRDPEKSLGDLVTDLTSETGDLITAHIDLAKTEIKQDIADAGKGAGMLGAGAIAALVAVFMLSAAAAWGLAELMTPALAFLIVGVIWAAVALGLAITGSNRLGDVDPMPRQTQIEIQEDKQWLKNQAN